MILDHKVQRHIREQIMGRYIPERKLSLILENKTIKFVSQEEDVYIKKCKNVNNDHRIVNYYGKGLLIGNFHDIITLFYSVL